MKSTSLRLESPGAGMSEPGGNPVSGQGFPFAVTDTYGEIHRPRCTSRACRLSIIPLGSGNIRGSNCSVPMQDVPALAWSGGAFSISHGLSIQSVWSGMPRRSNWSASSSTSSVPWTVSRHFISPNCCSGGIAGRPVRAVNACTICAGEPAYTSYARWSVLKHSCVRSGWPNCTGHGGGSVPPQSGGESTAFGNAVRPIAVVSAQMP